MTTRPYSTALTPSTPIRTHHHHHHHHHSHHQSSSSSTPTRTHHPYHNHNHQLSSTSSRLKPTSGFPAAVLVAPVTPQRSSLTIAGGAKTALHSRRKQRPNTLLSLTEPRHHHHHLTTSSCIEPASSTDRFIPNRKTMNMDVARRALFSDHSTTAAGKRKQGDDTSSSDDNDDVAPTTVPASFKRVQKAYKRQMMSTLCNIPLNHLDEHGEPKSLLSLCGSDDSSSNDKTTSTTSTTNDKNGSHYHPDPFALDFLRTMKVGTTSDSENDAASSYASADLAARLLASSRKLPDRPYKTLDAYNVHNDFYLSLMSWSHENVLAVALGPKVFLYNVLTGAVHTLFVDGNEGHYIMSVKWCHDGGNSHILAVTTSSNNAIMFFDCHQMQRLTTTSLLTQYDRVFSLSWKNEHFCSAGTSNGTILNYDIRHSSRRPVSKCHGGHSSQVCGLAWSPDGSTLASGCNDDALSLWDLSIVQQSGSGIVAHSPRLHVPHAHTAAIKAIAWCPHMSNVLATGGGTRCKHIKIWNTLTGSLKNSVDTGSQVSSLVWSKHNMELCSGHGYVHNQVSLWHYYPALTKMKDFKFHNDRIISMDMSPDGYTMATLGGDEILCLWDMFGSSRHSGSKSSSSSATGRPRNHPVPSFGVPVIR